jgi:hypothetical protein
MMMMMMMMMMMTGRMMMMMMMMMMVGGRCSAGGSQRFCMRQQVTRRLTASKPLVPTLAPDVTHRRNGHLSVTVSHASLVTWLGLSRSHQGSKRVDRAIGSQRSGMMMTMTMMSCQPVSRHLIYIGSSPRVITVVSPCVRHGAIWDADDGDDDGGKDDDDDDDDADDDDNNDTH